MIKETSVDWIARGFVNILKPTANEDMEVMYLHKAAKEKHKVEVISLLYDFIATLKTDEEGDIVYTKLPEELYTEIYGKNEQALPSPDN